MRVLNVNSTLGLKAGGGTAERTFQMSQFLAKQGVDCKVLTLKIDLDMDRIDALKTVEVIALPCIWNRFYLPWASLSCIKRLIEETDIIHIMGHWGVLNALVYILARRAKKPYVVCPAGALPLFGRSLFLKHFYNLVVGRSLIRNASAWIAVTTCELPHFERYGIQPSKVTVIPNGINHEDFLVPINNNFFKQNGLDMAPFILFMGRLNPIKGPDLLLQAFIMAKSKIPKHHLVFAGPDGGMLSQLIQDVKQARLSDYVHFVGYLSGADKSAAYHNAQLLVVPSRQEAMSIVAIEAGVCGTLALLTDQCGFSEVAQIDSRLEVAATVDGISDGLINLLGNEGVTEQISTVWKDFVVKNYTWDHIVQDYIHLYKNLVLSRMNI